MKLGFIGFGEVSYEMAKGLVQEGLTDLVAFDPLKDDPTRGKQVHSRAVQARTQLLDTPEEVARQASLILAAVPGTKALPAALQLIHALDSSKLYVDVSTSSPNTKRQIALALQDTGAKFVDAALMGGLTLLQHRVPILLSGPGSDEFIRQMSPYHMVLHKVSDSAGEAIAIKLVRSIYMKGIAALAIEMLQAATALEVEPLVIQSISQTLDSKPFEPMMDFLVTASAVHAERQAHEMREVQRMLEELGICPTMTEATVRALSGLACQNLTQKLQGRRPSSWKEAVCALEQ